MWIRVSDACLPAPFLAVVSADGEYFFKASDIGRLLNYRGASHFANRYARLRVRDIVFKGIDLPLATQNALVFTYDEVLTLVGKSSRNSCLTREYFSGLFTGGDCYVSVRDPPLTCSIHMKHAPQIQIDRETSPADSANFFQYFKTMALEFYDRISDKPEIIDVESDDESVIVGSEYDPTDHPFEIFDLSDDDEISTSAEEGVPHYGLPSVSRVPERIMVVFDEDSRPYLYERVRN